MLVSVYFVGLVSQVHDLQFSSCLVLLFAFCLRKVFCMPDLKVHSSLLLCVY